MILNNETANAVMDSLIDETEVRVYDSNEKPLTIGVVVKVFKNGFRVKHRRGWAPGTAETTYLWKNGLIVIKA